MSGTRTAPATGTAITWPAASTVVRLEWTLATIDARVLRAGEDDVLLALVGAGRNAAMPDEGGSMVLWWGDGRGLHERPIRLTSRRAGLLHIAPDGPVRTTQRRRFFRAPVTLDVTLEHDGATLPAVSTDLSEGGMRVTLRGAAPPHRADVTAHLCLDGDAVALPLTVVRTAPNGTRLEVGLAFEDLPTPAADLIRREVFTAQVAARRNGQHL